MLKVRIDDPCVMDEEYENLKKLSSEIEIIRVSLKK